MALQLRMLLYNVTAPLSLLSPSHRPWRRERFCGDKRSSCLGGRMAVSDAVRVQDAHGLRLVTKPRKAWERAYARSLLLLDGAAGLSAALTAYALRFGGNAAHNMPYVLLTILMPLLWVGAIAAARAYESRFLGTGPEEFRRVLTAAVLLIAAVGTVSWAVKYELARGYVVVALPLATALTMLLRLVARQRLHARRRRGECLHRVVVVGHELAVLSLVRQFSRDPAHGLQVVGACLPTLAQRDSLLKVNVAVAGTFQDVPRAVALTQADSVAVLTSPEMDGAALRRLSWELERSGTELYVAPALIDVAGPRIAIRPVDGLPLLHVDHPELTGGRRLAKGLFDRFVAAVAIVLLSPLMLLVAAAVRVTSPGPALFRQTRVGLHGKEFTIVKFRTMVVDAEQQLSQVLHLNVHGDRGILFKMHRDPRVTRVGAFLRRYSLDELPQLFNVFTGTMSLVGPRPPLPREVVGCGSDVHRRLLVKPGLTGLWQVSGRSNLDWDESLRLDLRYVENWTLALDMMIIARTIRAVVRGTGAY